jgi:hypothetical protein
MRSVSEGFFFFSFSLFLSCNIMMMNQRMNGAVRGTKTKEKEKKPTKNANLGEQGNWEEKPSSAGK